MPAAFTVEDGTGVANANAYVTVSFADDYHAERGNQAWFDATIEKKRAAIVLATDYVENVFGAAFVGTKATEEQGLFWPADGAFVDGVQLEGVPLDLQRAVAEYALRALEGASALVPDASLGGMVVQESESEGGTSRSVTYAQPSAGVQTSMRSIPAADRRLRRLLGVTTVERL